MLQVDVLCYLAVPFDHTYVCLNCAISTVHAQGPHKKVHGRQVIKWLDYGIATILCRAYGICSYSTREL